VTMRLTRILPRLTAEDLKDLGVGLVGHRRTLLDAIAALRGVANTKEPPSEALPHAPASQVSARPATVAPAADAVAERRCLTVMSRDLVGSTGISARWSAAVHPRACGERCGDNTSVEAAHGSSPRVRGTRPVTHCYCVAARFIPARAGNAYLERLRLTQQTVHIITIALRRGGAMNFTPP
jgi:SAM domain (Sterile alpha motif)